MAVFRALELPFCTVLQADPWDAPAGRYFVSYSVRSSYRWLLGHAVVDEFGTFSSPVFVAPAALLGAIYGFGISLGHRRDPEMALDLGWPPLCAGLDRPAPELPENWQDRLMDAIVEGAATPNSSAVESWRAGGFETTRWRRGEVTVVGTSAPLLPRQLRRLCDREDSALTIAFATGNRITRPEAGEELAVRVLSENLVDGLARRDEDGGSRIPG